MVEVDETYIGGQEAGLPGGRARGKRVLTGVAVEILEPKGFGRCRMRPLADATAASLHRFVTDFVEPRTTVITDGWQSYCGLDQLGYTHRPCSQLAARARGEDPGELLPGVHRVASLAKRWLLGTHHGAVDRAHLASYLDEFVFRFNRRRSRRRGWCSTGCLSSPLFTNRCATRIWSPPSDPVPCHPRRRTQAHTRRASSALGPTVHGETPVKWRAQSPLSQPRRCQVSRGHERLWHRLGAKVLSSNLPKPPRRQTEAKGNGSIRHNLTDGGDVAATVRLTRSASIGSRRSPREET